MLEPVFYFRMGELLLDLPDVLEYSHPVFRGAAYQRWDGVPVWAPSPFQLAPKTGARLRVASSGSVGLLLREQVEQVKAVLAAGPFQVQTNATNMPIDATFVQDPAVMPQFRPFDRAKEYWQFDFTLIQLTT
jgi:hypothetical protein